jgi:hypothetical protein
MLYEERIIIVLLILAGFANAGMDVIDFNPTKFIFQNDWWLKKGKFSWDKRKWYTKYIFTMFSDGWHFLKFVNIISYLVIISLLYGSYWFLYTFVFYCIVGCVFEICYKYLWRKK